MKILHSLAFVMCLAASAAAQTTPATPAPAAADVVGTWDATVTSAQGPIPTQIKLKKEADKLVGTISSQMGESPIEAEVKGKALSIWFNFQGQNGPMAIEMNGTVDGDSIKGPMSAGGQVAGDWVATRVKESKAPSTPSLTGSYNVTVELPNITANPTIELKQDGEKLAGEYVSAQYGKFPIEGTIKGADVSFSFAMNVEGNGLNVTYTGVVDKDGAIKGSVAYGDMMSGTFTAAKKK